MSLGRTIVSPMLRSFAGLALVVFVVAQSLCFIHCHLGGGHGNNDAQPSCHSSVQAKSHHNGHDAPAPVPTASCSTLKTMLAGGDAPTLVAPQLHTHYLLAPMTLALDASKVQPMAPFSCHIRTRDRVFTPEMCLGPAFRSLAPPFIG